MNEFTTLNSHIPIEKEEKTLKAFILIDLAVNAQLIDAAYYIRYINSIIPVDSNKIFIL